MNNSALRQAFSAILQEHEPFLEAKYRDSKSAMAKLSGIFLPSVHEDYSKARRKVMLVGRETAGWNVIPRDRDTKEYKEAFSGLDRYIDASMVKHRKFIEKESIKHNERGATFHNFIKMLIPVVGKEGLVWANLFCHDLKDNYPVSSPYFKKIKTISQKLLTEQIKILRPDVIIFANGSVSAPFRAEFFPYQGPNAVCSNFADPGKEYGIGNKLLWQFDLFGTHRCYRIHHPSCFRKEATKVRGFLVDKVLPEYFESVENDKIPN